MSKQRYHMKQPVKEGYRVFDWDLRISWQQIAVQLHIDKIQMINPLSTIKNAYHTFMIIQPANHQSMKIHKILRPPKLSDETEEIP